MNTRSSGNRWRLLVLVALAAGLSALPEADAKGSKGGGHSGGHAARPPRMSMPHQSFKAPRMPHAASPSHTNAARPQSHANNKQSHANNSQARSNNSQAHQNGTQSQAKANGSQSRNKNAQVHNGNTLSHANSSQVHASNTSATGTSNTSATGTSGTGTGTGTGTARSSSTNATASAGSSPHTYTYGTGTNARSYRAYGYGRGYRNRYNGSRYGYGRSQSNNRAIVARLRSVHSSLARVNQSYQGHRVRAMHNVSMAIRQLSHRSMVYNNVGFGAGGNNRLAMGNRRGGGGAGNGARQGQAMPQAQSDARMGQALRNLQGINMQLASQGTNTGGHARAHGHVTQAIRELNTALAIR